MLATPDLAGLSDRELLLGGREDVIAENRASAQRWARLVEFFRRREQRYPAKKRASQHFALTARQETVVEVGELWAVSESWLRKQLNVALCLAEHFPEIWQLCLSGALDPVPRHLGCRRGAHQPRPSRGVLALRAADHPLPASAPEGRRWRAGQ